MGYELNGKNVKFNTEGNNSCWVGSNHYDIFEVPANYNSNKYKLIGDFLCLAYNTDFDYWIMADMTYKINFQNTNAYGKVDDYVSYAPYGSYDILTASSNKASAISKKENGFYVTYGGKGDPKSEYFDNLGSRKKAYGYSGSELLGASYGISYNKYDVTDYKPVEIYKSHKNKKKS